MTKKGYSNLLCMGLERSMLGKDGKGRMHVRLFSFIAGLIFFLLLIMPMNEYLVIRDSRTDRLLWETPSEAGLTFAIRWLHSIHRTPVVEFFRVEGDSLVEYRMSFANYGIGMNSELAPGERLVNRNGTFYVENMRRVFPEIRLFIGQVRANHTLLFQGAEIPLRTLHQAGKSITIRLEKRSILDSIGGKAS